MSTWLSWSRQPTTVAGISALIGTVAGLALGQLSWAQAMPLLVGAVASAVLPDNTLARHDAQNLANEIISHQAGS